MVQKIVTAQNAVTTVHAKLNITPLLSIGMDDIDATTKALNLWDIEQRINQIQMELDMLHQAKAEILGGDYANLEYSERDQNLLK